MKHLLLLPLLLFATAAQPPPAPNPASQHHRHRRSQPYPMPRALRDLARTGGRRPNEVIVGLDSIYRYFEPVFDTLAWQPHAAELARQRTAYAAFLAQGKLLQSFGRLRAFYGSVWPDALPYRIQLCPQLDDRKGFTNHGYVSGNLVLLDCHPTSRDFVDGSTVVFHEMAHSLSVQQHLALQQRIDRWYTKNPSPNRRHAYYLMEEALATAAGEWVHAQQTGQPEPGEWYNDDYINRYARALYPAVTAYVERGQTLDSAFVAQAIATFDRTFPQAATDYVNLFRKVLYWTDAADIQAAIQPFADQFHSTLSNTSNPILGDAETLALAQGGTYTPVILVTRQHAATLRYLRQNFPALRPHQLAPDQNFVFALTTPTGPLIVVNTHDTKYLQNAAAAIKRQGQINLTTPLTTLK